MENTVRHVLVIAVFGCFGFTAMASAAHTSRATANFLSGGAVSALKAAAQASSAAPAKKRCIERISESALAPLYDELIASRLSQKDLELLERFYSSPLGIKYSKALIGRKNPASVFSPAELSQLKSSLMAIPQEALFRATSSQDPEIAAREKAFVKPLLDACADAV